MPAKGARAEVKIPAGTVLTHRRRDGAVIEAMITEAGVRVGEQEYRSVNAAALGAGGLKAVDAWRFWRLADGRLLDALREVPAASTSGRSREEARKGKQRGSRKARAAKK